MSYRYAVQRYVRAPGGRGLLGTYDKKGPAIEETRRKDAEAAARSWVTSPLRTGPRAADVLRRTGLGAWQVVRSIQTETDEMVEGGVLAPRPHPAAQNLREAAQNAVVDFRTIAIELGETELRLSPALRAANRLQAAIDEDKHWRSL